LGQIAGGKNQIRLPMGLEHLLNNGIEAVTGIYAEQRAISTGHKVRIC